VSEEKLPGDVLLLVIDNRFFRAHSDDWADQLASISADLDRRLLGGGVQLVDRKQVRPWPPSRPLPPEGDVLADQDFAGTFARAFQVIEDFGRKAHNPEFKTFLIWLDDVNPDSTPQTAGLSKPKRWIMLLWHGRPGTSQRLTELLGDDWIVRFKQDTTGLRSSILYYARRGKD
jgi:hypothetical protein